MLMASSNFLWSLLRTLSAYKEFVEVSQVLVIAIYGHHSPADLYNTPSLFLFAKDRIMDFEIADKVRDESSRQVRQWFNEGYIVDSEADHARGSPSKG